MARSRRKPLAEVFLNIPYDKKFERLFLAYISGISARGLVPRATLEIPSSARRLDRILSLIRQCRYSIHGLSRVELDARRPKTPRFNMPFELGLAVAHERAATKNRHQWFVCESRNLRLAKSLSDLNGTDPFIHDGTVAGFFRELYGIFQKPGRQPSTQQMSQIYSELRQNLATVLHNSGSTSLFKAGVFKNLCIVASAAADKMVP